MLQAAGQLQVGKLSALASCVLFLSRCYLLSSLYVEAHLAAHFVFLAGARGHGHQFPTCTLQPSCLGPRELLALTWAGPA